MWQRSWTSSATWFAITPLRSRKFAKTTKSVLGTWLRTYELGARSQRVSRRWLPRQTRARGSPSGCPQTLPKAKKSLPRATRRGNARSLGGSKAEVAPKAILDATVRGPLSAARTVRSPSVSLLATRLLQVRRFLQVSARSAGSGSGPPARDNSGRSEWNAARVRKKRHESDT